MADSLPTDVQQMVEAQIASGRYSTEEEVLRDALRALTEEEEDFVAVQAALDEWRAGDQGRPFKEVFDDVRREE